MNCKDYYSWNLNLRAMFETIGNYHQREYAINRLDGGLTRWLYLPEGYWSACQKQFEMMPPAKYYYSIAHLDWKAANCYYKFWRPNFVGSSENREVIRMKCNAKFDDMVFGFDCALDIDSHDKNISIQENVDRAAVVAEKASSHLDSINVPYILYYSGRGFTIRVPWDKLLLELGDRYDALDLMHRWVARLAEECDVENGAKIDNLMANPKLYTKVPYSLIVYDGLTTYAKRITRGELAKFKVPEPQFLHGEHRNFHTAGTYSNWIEELKAEK